MSVNESIGIGTILGGYKIERLLGKGGMGVVYKAHESSLNRKVALKILSSKLSDDKEFITRFKKEAQIIAALNHPNIVSILSFGEDLDHYYFAMEYIKGRDLDEILQEKKTIPLMEALSITQQVAEALSEAGKKGIVHRDLKPANIMIDEMNRARVTDFGVARIESAQDNLTKTGMFLGSPQYASPEQARGLHIDPRSDIYALGAVLYRMLSGTPPTTGDSPLAVMVKVFSEPVTPIEEVNGSVPKPVCALIAKMMAKDVENRYQSADEVIADINRCMESLKSGQAARDGETVVQTSSLRGKTGPGSRTDLLTWGVAGVLILILLALLVWGGMSYFSEKPADVFVSDEPATLTQTTADSAHQDPAEVLKQSEPATASLPDQEQPPAQETEHTLAIATGAPSSLPETTAQVQDADTPSTGDKREPLPSEKETPAAKTLVTGLSPETLHPAETTIERNKAVPPPPAERALPEQPTVLLIVTGPEDMTLPLQTHLETALFDNSLEVVSPVEIPVLYEKMQMGDIPVNWYGVQQYTPGGTAHVLILAKIQKAGTTMLRFHGTSQEQITAMYSIRIMDMDTGKQAVRSITGSVKYTVWNMDEEFQDTLSASARTLGPSIQTYWDEKRKK